MKTLIGVVVGLLAGVVLVAALNVTAGIDKFWPAIIVGILVGYIARAVDAPGAASYLRGALAAVATIAAIMVGQIAAAQVTQQMGPKVSPRGAEIAAEVDAETTGESGGAATAAAPVAERGRVEVVSPSESFGATSPGDSFATMDIIFLVAGCLLAYEFGKGKAAPTADEEADAEGDGETAAADPGEEPAGEVSADEDA